MGVAAVLAVGAAACDALLGLGQYKEVSCAGSDCPDASGDGAIVEAGMDASSGDDASDGGVGSDAPDDAIFPGDASNDGPGPHELWAHWPMPNPDASIGGDASTSLPNPMSYDAGSQTVLDRVTKLVWERSGNSGPMAFDAAASHCQGINMRLPTRIELVSLVDFTQQPTVDQTTFPGTASGRYWTESVVAHDGGADAAVPYWTVDFTDGLVHNDTTTQAYVRCVSGGTP